MFPCLFPQSRHRLRRAVKDVSPGEKWGGEGENSPGEVSIRARSFRGIRLLTGCSPFCLEVVFDGQLQLAELHRLLVAGMGTGLVEFEHSG